MPPAALSSLHTLVDRTKEMHSRLQTLNKIHMLYSTAWHCVESLPTLQPASAVSKPHEQYKLLTSNLACAAYAVYADSHAYTSQLTPAYNNDLNTCLAQHHPLISCCHWQIPSRNLLICLSCSRAAVVSTSVRCCMSSCHFLLAAV